MKKLRALDLSLLPEIQSASILIRPAREIEDAITGFAFMHEFYERTQAAIMFVLNTDSESESWRNEAHLRAGLNEFYSLEDAARRAFRRSQQASAVPALSDSRHPLVQVMYMLRHINVHVKPSPTSVHDISVRLNDPEDTREFQWGAVMLAEETASDLLAHSEVRQHYATDDMKNAMDWLLKEQMAFGIGQVLRVGIESYCREVIDALPR